MPKKCEIIAFSNQKGGTGKTTSVITIATGLKREGKKVLAIDGDPQSNLTMSQGLFQPDELENTLADLVYHYAERKTLPKNMSDFIRHGKNFDFIPSDVTLAGFDLKLAGVTSREYILKRVLEPYRELYDYILIDCSPSLGLLLYNIFTASDKIIVPVQAEFYSAKGLELVTQSFGTVKSETNPELEIAGILLTMADSRSSYPEHIRDIVTEHFGEYVKIFPHMIPRSVNVSRGQEKAQSIYDITACADVASAYNKIVEEFLNDEQ